MERDENVVFEEYRTATDPQAKEVLLAELNRLLRKHAYAICWLTMREPRKDIVNFAVFKALENMDKFRGDAKFSTWFQHIVQNLCHDEGREMARHKNETAIDDLNPDDMGQLAVEADDARLQLAEIAEGLDQEDRDFLEAKLTGKNEVELSEELGLTREGVRSRWNRIKQRILRQM
jgi:RNA polymerase sigma factor (sigma-70 family)